MSSSRLFGRSILVLHPDVKVRVAPGPRSPQEGEVLPPRRVSQQDLHDHQQRQKPNAYCEDPQLRPEPPGRSETRTVAVRFQRSSWIFTCRYHSSRCRCCPQPPPRSPCRPMACSSSFRTRAASSPPGGMRAGGAKGRRPSAELNKLVGASGSALTALRPEGRIALGRQQYDARSDLHYIPRDSQIRVVGVHCGRLLVQMAEDAQLDAAADGATHRS